jgi:aminopeptidase YwaD
MQRILTSLGFLAILLSAQAQVWEYRIAKEAQRVDSIEQIISELQRIGIRVTGSTAFDSATQWVVNKYTQLGYAPVIDTFTYGTKNSYNVIIEKPGSQSDAWIIIGAHLDAVSISPGANDNGSGVAATLEIARILKNVDCKVGVRIINFGAEEQGLHGSNHYVNNTLSATDNIQLMLNLDQLGGTLGQNNTRIKCERDVDDNPSTNNALSSLKTDTLGRLINLYTTLIPVQSNAYGSDYMPFQNAGYVITGLYQESVDPNYHSANDKLENMDIAATTEVIKGAVAATLYFARINTSANISQTSNLISRLYPNPASNWVKIIGGDKGINYVILTNAFGQQVMSTELTSDNVINIQNLTNGLYSVSIYNAHNSVLLQSRLIIAR